VANEPGVASSNAGRSARLAEVLTGETGDHQFDGADVLEGADIPDQPRPAKPRLQDTGPACVDLAEKCGFVACLLKSQLKAANSGEQPRGTKTAGILRSADTHVSRDYLEPAAPSTTDPARSHSGRRGVSPRRD